MIAEERQREKKELQLFIHVQRQLRCRICNSAFEGLPFFFLSHSFLSITKTDFHNSNMQLNSAETLHAMNC